MHLNKGGIFTSNKKGSLIWIVAVVVILIAIIVAIWYYLRGPYGKQTCKSGTTNYVKLELLVGQPEFIKVLFYHQISKIVDETVLNEDYFLFQAGLDVFLQFGAINQTQYNCALKQRRDLNE